MLLSSLLLLPILLAEPAYPTTLNPSLLPTLQRFAGYAGAAYCGKNYISASSPATFPPNQFSQNGSAEIGASFLNVGDRQTSGLLLVDHVHQVIVISFEGTVSNANWETNLDFVAEDASSICGAGCEMHGGFLDAWRSVAAVVTRNWTTLRARYARYTTVVTGHSLGGALAHVCAAALKQAEPNATMSLYTYASPRVGNTVFASYINQRFGLNNYRVTHLNDPVPRLPGRLLGFAHTAPEYHITSPHIKDVLSASKKVLAQPANMVVQATDVLVLPGPAESNEGNAGYSCTNVAMHDEYFIHIADCVADTGTPLLQSFAGDICHVLLMCCNWGLNFGTMWRPNGSKDGPPGIDV